jgi:hypothetical protein
VGNVVVEHEVVHALLVDAGAGQPLGQLGLVGQVGHELLRRILELLLLVVGDLLAVELGRLLEVEPLRELDLEELLVDLLGLVEGRARHREAHEHVARGGLAWIRHLARQLLLGFALAPTA